MANLSTFFPRYHPALMDYDGTSNYTKSSVTTAGNKVTATARIKVASFTGGGTRHIFEIKGPTHIRMAIAIRASDYATVDQRSKLVVFCQNNAGGYPIVLYSTNVVADDSLHSIFAALDGDAGAATLYIDGADADDTGNPARALGTATMDTGSGSIGVGATAAGSGDTLGEIGYFGHSEAYLTNWSDFMHPNGNPKELDETTWIEWSGGSVPSPLTPPLFWNEHGDLENNFGSAGNMTRNGTIVVGKGGN